MDRPSLDKSFKTLWQARYRRLWCFLCPLCRAPRRIPFRSQPGGGRHLFQVLLTSAIFTLFFWSQLNWRGVVCFFPFWTLFEFAYRWRMRAILSCPQCGFDPYLFRSDIHRARGEIESHWRKKFKEKGVPYPEPRGSRPRDPEIRS